MNTNKINGMYIYTLCQFELVTDVLVHKGGLLMHEKNLSNKEFDKICKKALDETDSFSNNIEELKQFLIKHHGFKEVKVNADFRFNTYS